MTGEERGQLVLVAAAVAALALVPVVAAYLQFGYAPAVADVDDAHESRVSRALDRIGDDAAEAATGADWTDRERAVERLNESLAPRVRTVERARLGDGVVVNATLDDSLADTVDCPGGPGRAFGSCETIGGVVVQDRADETVVVAMAFRIRVTTPSGTLHFERVVRPE